MADDVRVTNFPDSGSRERVAFDLMVHIRHASTEGGARKSPEELIALYGRCLKAVTGISHD